MNYWFVFLIKPDAWRRKLVGTVLGIIEKDFEIHALRSEIPSLRKIEMHYAEHIGKPFYERLCSFMSNGMVTAVLVHGDITKGRQVMNDIRALAEGGEKNLVHCSDSSVSAFREQYIWFSQE